MVYEFAVDPGSISSVDRVRFLADNVGVPNGRLIAEYPGSWRRSIFEALNRLLPAQRARLETQVQRLRPFLIPPHRAFDPQRDWLTNAESVHQTKPFRAILSTANPRTHPEVLLIDDVDGSTPLWSAPHTVCVPRKAPQMSEAVRLLLELAAQVVFVDPHFDPCLPRYQRTFRRFVSCFASSRSRTPPTLKIIIKARLGAADGDPFENNCRYYLAPMISSPMNLQFIRASERVGAATEKLHNRYILTDWGGVQFGVGLDDDDGQAGQTDDLSLLSKESFDLRWRQYALMEGFDVASSSLIQGTA